MRTSIKEILQKCKSFVAILSRKDILLAVLLILVSLASFGLGRLSKIEDARQEVRIIPPSTEPSFYEEGGLLLGDEDMVMGASTAPKKEKIYVASKNGTRYYFPWCSGVERINEENKVWFDTKDAAEKAGLTPATNCKGL